MQAIRNLLACFPKLGVNPGGRRRPRATNEIGSIVLATDEAIRVRQLKGAGMEAYHFAFHLPAVDRAETLRRLRSQLQDLVAGLLLRFGF